ncbi:hypothetical protein RB195_016469 [Necator americanus]|uniref:Uncharacterized protein n=1 Tax=Necator americanus TaxID=51031 RepID=A0ABR1C3T6_NECAM
MLGVNHFGGFDWEQMVYMFSSGLLQRKYLCVKEAAARPLEFTHLFVHDIVASLRTFSPYPSGSLQTVHSLRNYPKRKKIDSMGSDAEQFVGLYNGFGRIWLQITSPIDWDNANFIKEFASRANVCFPR